MPKLYVFAACEKVILDQASVPSLIALFTKLKLLLPGQLEDVPENAVAPKEWAVFASWDRVPSDEGKIFNQCLQVLYPDGKVFFENRDVKFTIKLGERQHNAVRIVGFPIGQKGDYTIRMWLEENGSVVVEPVEIRLEVEIERQPGTPSQNI
jgi:hypothetical protein